MDIMLVFSKVVYIYIYIYIFFFPLLLFWIKLHSYSLKFHLYQDLFGKMNFFFFKNRMKIIFKKLKLKLVFRFWLPILRKIFKILKKKKKDVWKTTFTFEIFLSKFFLSNVQLIYPFLMINFKFGGEKKFCNKNKLLNLRSKKSLDKSISILFSIYLKLCH